MKPFRASAGLVLAIPLLIGLAILTRAQERSGAQPQRRQPVRAAQEKAQTRSPADAPRRKAATPQDGKVLPDAIQEAQSPRTVEQKRPEQELSEHDRSNVFSATKARP